MLGQAGGFAGLGLGLGGGSSAAGQIAGRDTLNLTGLGGVRNTGQLLSPLSPVAGILGQRPQVAFQSPTAGSHAPQSLNDASSDCGKKSLQENDALHFLSEVCCPDQQYPLPFLTARNWPRHDMLWRCG